MNLPVSLAGHTALWQFRDGAALDRWLSARPWRQGGFGGLSVLRLSVPAQMQELIPGIARSVRAAEEESFVRIVTLRAEIIAEGFLHALALALYNAPLVERPYAEQFKLVAEWATDRPTLIVVPPTEPADRDLFSQARSFADQAPKLRTRPGPTPTILLMDTIIHPHLLAPVTYDFTVGRPAEGILDLARDQLSRGWRAYVHHRLAWETGGNLALALDWDSRYGFSELRMGDDNGLEAKLNLAAEGAFSGVEEGMQESMAEYLNELITNKTGRAANRENDLVAVGLLWRPLGGKHPRPTPWAARALLFRDESEAVRYLLTTELTCAPLVHEILERCFELENRARSLIWYGREEARPPKDAEDRYQDFIRGDRPTEGDCYPKGCPSIPRNAWPFVMFGEMLKEVPNPTGKSNTQLWWDLLHLRNALSHGHYASWPAVTKLLTIEDRMRV